MLSPYIIALIVLLVIGLIGFGAYYYLKKRRTAGSAEDEYIWVGPGEHPFKKKAEDNK